MDPYAPETLRHVGTRARLRTCRRICDDITVNGPASPVTIARRSGIDSRTVVACVIKMHRAGWVTLADGIVECNPIADPFPAGI